MFGKDKKELINRELKVYKKEQMVIIDREIEDYRREQQTRVDSMGRMCLKQLGEYEHEFHSTKEERGIQLAKLEAQVENLENQRDLTKAVNKAKDDIIACKNEEIARLTSIIKDLTDKQFAIFKK